MGPTAQGNVAKGTVFQLASLYCGSWAVTRKYSIGCIWNCSMRKHGENGGKQVGKWVSLEHGDVRETELYCCHSFLKR